VRALSGRRLSLGSADMQRATAEKKQSRKQSKKRDSKVAGIWRAVWGHSSGAQTARRAAHLDELLTWTSCSFGPPSGRVAPTLGRRQKKDQSGSFWPRSVCPSLAGTHSLHSRTASTGPKLREGPSAAGDHTSRRAASQHSALSAQPSVLSTGHWSLV